MHRSGTNEAEHQAEFHGVLACAVLIVSSVRQPIAVKAKCDKTQIVQMVCPKIGQWLNVKGVRRRIRTPERPAPLHLNRRRIKLSGFLITTCTRIEYVVLRWIFRVVAHLKVLGRQSQQKFNGC
jgi:hypothetical protein